MRRELKITVIGTGGVGKSSIVTNKCLDHGPTIAKEYSRNFDVDGQTYKIRLLDTGGLHEYTLLWKRDHADVDCFIICYSIDFQSSFDDVHHWYQEIQDYYRINKTIVPIILVGTKSDLRQSVIKCISMEKGIQLSRKINAVKYIECSALNNKNLNTILEEAVWATNIKHKKYNVIKMSQRCFLF